MRLSAVALGVIGASAAQDASPLRGVIKMLEDTVKDLLDERKMQEDVYMKMGCVVKKTTERNNKLIDENETTEEDAKNELALLGSTTLSSEGAELTAKIDQKKAAIKQGNEDLEAATAANVAHVKELDTGIAALADAELQVQGKTGLLSQRVQLKKTLATLTLTSKAEEMITAFDAQAPEQYSSQIGQVLDLIKNLKTQYQQEKIDVEDSFAKDKAAREALIKEMNDTLANLEMEFTTGAGEAAAKAARKEELEATISAAQQVILDAKNENTKMAADAADQAQNWTIFIEDSNGQEAAINKAMEILGGDEARDQFQDTEDNESKFLQVGHKNHISLRSMAASAAIKTLVAAIDGMAGELKDEKKSIEASTKRCEKDALSLLEKAKQAAEQMDGHAASIAAMTATIQQEQDKQEHLTEEIKQTMQERADAIEKFEGEEKDLEKILADLRAAIMLVSKGIGALEEYNFQAGGKSSFHSDKKTSPLAPVIQMLKGINTEFGTKKNKRTTQLEVLKKDHQDYLSDTGISADVTPEDQFVDAPTVGTVIGDLETERNESIERENRADKKKVSGETSHSQEEKTLRGADGAGGVIGTLNLIQPGCDHWMINGPGRKEAIATEIASLLEAKTVLANPDLGLAAGDEAHLDAREAGADKHDHAHAEYAGGKGF